MQTLIMTVEDTIETLARNLYGDAYDIWMQASNIQRTEIWKRLLKLKSPSPDDVNNYIEHDCDDIICNNIYDE